MMNEDDIRGLNCDFNYNNYGVFYERIEEEMNGGKDQDGENASPDKDQAEGQSERDPLKPPSNNLVGFQKIISEQNLLNKMWQNVEIDYEGFQEKYEDWLEEEVWSYFD